MYEENCSPLPPGDCVDAFASTLTEVERLSQCDQQHGKTSDGALQEANTAAQPRFADICRRLLLPGSRLLGFDHLASLSCLAQQGAACLLCLNHRSNLDVPTLYALIEDQADLAVFHRIIWISGHKLDEDRGITPLLARCFHRIVVTPKNELIALECDAERRLCGRRNMRAYRAMRDVRRQGWVLALFPAGTRFRPGNQSSAQAIVETDSYLKRFEYLVLGRIDGCTLPVTRDHDLSHEAPRLDRVVYTFSPIMEAGQWRNRAAARYPDLDQRAATSQAIMEDIAALRE
jgi:glycerol-3-phosphate O-acyltransferase